MLQEEEEETDWLSYNAVVVVFRSRAPPEIWYGVDKRLHPGLTLQVSGVFSPWGQQETGTPRYTDISVSHTSQHQYKH